MIESTFLKFTAYLKFTHCISASILALKIVIVTIRTYPNWGTCFAFLGPMELGLGELELWQRSTFTLSNYL